MRKKQTNKKKHTTALQKDYHTNKYRGEENKAQRAAGSFVTDFFRR